MDNLVNYMDNDFSILLGAVKCLPMPSSDRDAVTQTIHQQCSKIKVNLQCLVVSVMHMNVNHVDFLNRRIWFSLC